MSARPLAPVPWSDQSADELWAAVLRAHDAVLANPTVDPRALWPVPPWRPLLAFLDHAETYSLIWTLRRDPTARAGLGHCEWAGLALYAALVASQRWNHYADPDIWLRRIRALEEETTR